MRHHRIQLDSEPLTDEFLASQDCIVIITDHSAYDYVRIACRSRLIVDTRNAMGEVAPELCRIVKA